MESQTLQASKMRKLDIDITGGEAHGMKYKTRSQKKKMKKKKKLVRNS